ncbi:MAG: restriction endonuclease subunit S [Burkholderiales bacterium]|nr:Type-1 restriction enzyme EcoKI specificity protein [Rhodocyclaceae bacterium]MCZ2175260.1 restriction endonuclease subunit S [Burkholderiales bacterium]MCZ2419490.1 restriction endonuclease subunit S [Burkholderiales bacterium]
MSSWRTARLEEVAQILGGGTPARSEESYFGGGIAWATPTDVTALDQLYISETKEAVTDAGLRNSSTKLMPPGAVLLTSRATIGFTAVSKVPICTNQGFINFICGPDIVPEYLAYWLRTQKAKMFQHAGGTTFKEIARGTIRKFEVPVPPLPEQRRIVDLLSRAEGIVRLRREAEKKAAELISALFLDMFGDPATNPKGWPTATVGDAIDSADYGSSTKASDSGDGLPLIRMGNVSFEGKLDLTDLKFVELPPTEVDRYRLREGDILFNRTNSKELVGKTGLWSGAIDAVAASYFIRLRAKSDCLVPHYLWVFMNTGHMKRVLFETARGAIGQANINSKELKAFRLPLPPTKLQRQFETHCRSIAAMEEQQSAATAKAQEAFDALLGRVFSPAQMT